MRIPVPLAWALLLLTMFTAGMLRQFHEGTPLTPYIHPVVGSLLFFAIVFLLLVSAREFRIGAAPGAGVRLGSLTPLMLFLLAEKWVSLSLYGPIFYWITRGRGYEKLLDAQFRTFAGAGLLLLCLGLASLSLPTARKTWRRARPCRFLPAALQVAAVVAATYALLGLAAWGLGGHLQLRWPGMGRLWTWIVIGQALLAFAEEVYYRGLLMSEIERLAPRLGARSPTVRRWIALLCSSIVFGMEHVRMQFGWDEIVRQLVFTISLGLLFGLLAMISANLHLCGGVHAWINWLLLGVAPYFVDEAGEPALPAGTYIGLTLILAFVSAFVFQRFRRRRRH